MRQYDLAALPAFHPLNHVDEDVDGQVFFVNDGPGSRTEPLADHANDGLIIMVPNLANRILVVIFDGMDEPDDSLVEIGDVH